MKERAESKNLKKRKSQDSFFLKQKFNQPNSPHLHYLQPKKIHNRASLSVLEIPSSNAKEQKRRVNSLELTPADLVATEDLKSNKNSQPLKSRSILSNCLSDRNAVKDSHKLFKHKKTSNSNGDLQQEDLCSSLALKQKLSVIELQRQVGVAHDKSELYGIMVWILVIRKFFAKQLKNNKENSSTNINSLIAYLSKLQKSKIQSVKFTIERTNFEPELSREQLIQLLKAHFKAPPLKIQNKEKNREYDHHSTTNYPEVLNCLLQYQLKETVHAGSTKPREHPEDHQDVVETARFQEGTTIEQSKKPKKYIEIPYMIRPTPKNSAFGDSYLTSYNQSSEKSRELSKQISKQISPLTGKSKQSLNPSLSPFSVIQSSNSRSSLRPNESDTFIFKKAAHGNGLSDSSLGMLTLEGKSPREIMESEIYESMQRVGVACHRKNNVSFSLDNLEMEPCAFVEQTVHSFQEVLRKVKKIQSSYLQKSDGSEEKAREQQPSEEVNLFLEQLIDYKMAMRLDGEGVEHYSYFVSWEDIKEIKQHNCKLMQFLLQSTYMRDFLFALEGLKIDNSPYLYQNIKPYLHAGIRILNISNNNLNSLTDILQELSQNNALQFLNISHNNFTDISQVLCTLKRIRELHAKDNCIEGIPKTEFRCDSLKIIDLSNNKIGSERDLTGVACLKSLEILNLVGNPVLQPKNWKMTWKQSFSLELVYDIDSLYVMSEYGHHKDIGFSRSKKQVEQPRPPKIRTFIDGKLI